MIPIQGHAALTVAIVAVAIVLLFLYFGLAHERKRPSDYHDDH